MPDEIKLDPESEDVLDRMWEEAARKGVNPLAPAPKPAPKPEEPSE